MSKDAGREQASSHFRERFLALALLAASSLAVLWVLWARPTLGVAGQYQYPYRPAQPWGVAPFICLAGLPLLWGWVLVLRGGGPSTRRAERLAVGLLTGGSLVLHLATACLPKHFTGAEMMWPFVWKNTEGSYATEAAKLDDARRFVSNYAHWLDVSPVPGTTRWVHVHHPQVHPPGPILAFVGIERFFRAFPSLAAGVTDWAQRNLPSSAILSQREQAGGRHGFPAATSLTMALLTVVVASLAPLACYLAVRPLWPPAASLTAAGLTALVPGTHLFSPSFDQAYPVFTLLLVCCGVRAVVRRSAAWGAAFGAVLYALAFFHVAFALVALCLLLTLCLTRRAEISNQKSEIRNHFLRPLSAAALSFLTLSALLLGWLGYPTLRVILLCLRNNGLFNAAAARTWWPWVAVVPFEFALSLGFGLALVVACGWLSEMVAAVRARSLRARSALLLVPVAILAVLDLCGMNRGETARLWLFLTPLLVLGAVDFLFRRAREPRGLLARLAAAQAIQTLLFAIALDTAWTSTFMVKLLDS
ncbi:MAG: hypothetical protein FJ291_01795 [Planctomycetes bacterium]|nr:hypothetical protein [Planctomycetota bacterium]